MQPNQPNSNFDEEIFSSITTDLKRIASLPDRNLYAIFDGALFEDVSRELTQADLPHRSLFINVEDISIVDAGPWLVNFQSSPTDMVHEIEEIKPYETSFAEDEENSADILAASAGDDAEDSLPPPDVPLVPVPSEEHERRIDAAIGVLASSGYGNAAVFWIGDNALSNERMWRHSRSLNRVTIPATALSSDDEGDIYGDGETETVLFRHADGNVLAGVLPYLSETQFARFFSPALAATFIAPGRPSSSGSLIRRSVRPDGVKAPAGLLHLTLAQINGVEAERKEKNRRYTMAYLRDAAPEEAGELSDDELMAFVTRS